MRSTPWRDMPPERKAAEVAAHKRRKYLRDVGRPSLVPCGPARERLATLHQAYSMSTNDIAIGTGLAQATVSDLLRGRRTPSKGSAPIVKIPRRTHDLVMAFEPDPAFYNPDARVDPTGTQRRLQALALKGFSTAQLASFMGGDNHNQTWRVMRGQTRGAGAASHIYASTRDAVAEMYPKYVAVDPAEIGGTAFTISRARRTALRHGFAAADCWDDDTIDDPAALPEWTGACGTPEGYRIHVRETAFRGREMPPCGPCREAMETRHITSVGGFRFLADGLGEAIAQSGLSIKGLAKRLDVDEARVHKWRSGGYAPKFRSIVEQLADELHCELADLIVEPVCLLKPSRPVVAAGKFNPYKMRVILDVARVSQNKAADMCHAAHSSMTNWMLGRSGPASPDKLKGLAEALGIEATEFFS